MNNRTITAPGAIMCLMAAGVAGAASIIDEAAAQVAITAEGGWRVIRSNGIPKHRTGTFPNAGNPHRVTSQRHEFRVPLRPRPAGRITQLGMNMFGVAVNGVPFDPGAAEWWKNRRGGWRFEALSGAVMLSIDRHNAHVQQNGACHYHGLPTGLLGRLNPRRHSRLVGWAADGYPIYALYGYRRAKNPRTGVKAMRSGWRLKRGRRPGGGSAPGGGSGPGGRYDGTYVQDYEYVAGAGDLDQCNGRIARTPEFPNGTYAYFLTRKFPVIPRCWRGSPHQSFMKGPRGPGGRGFGRGRGGPPQGRGFGPPPRHGQGGGFGPPQGRPGFGRPEGRRRGFGAPPTYAYVARQLNIPLSRLMAAVGGPPPRVGPGAEQLRLPRARLIQLFTEAWRQVGPRRRR